MIGMVPSTPLVEMTSFLETVEKRAQATLLEQALARSTGPALASPVLTLGQLAGLVAEGPRNIYRRGPRFGQTSQWNAMAGRGIHPIG